MTVRAGSVYARQEQKFYEYKAFALTCLTTPLRHIEREAAGIVVAAASCFGRSKLLADVVEQPRIGRQIRSRRATNWLLVNRYQARNALQSRRNSATDRFGRRLQVVIIIGLGNVVPNMLRHQFHQNLAH